MTGAVLEPASQSRTAVRLVAYARAGIVVAIVVALDQLTKHLIVDNIAPGQVRKLVPGVQLVEAIQMNPSQKFYHH